MSSITELFSNGLGGVIIQKYSLSGNSFWVCIALSLFVAALISYLLGSVNFAVMISGGIYKDDVRTHGSKNAGTTNMLRTYGKKAAALTFAGDGVKAAIAILIGMAIFGRIGGYVAGLFCIIGHMYPVFFKFRGGKGIVVAAVMILMLDWRIFLILLLIFAALVAATKYISLGSIVCVMLYPIILYRLDVAAFEKSGSGGPSYDVIVAFLVTLLVVFKHRENIVRLYHGEESKLTFKKKSSAKADDESKNGGNDENG